MSSLGDMFIDMFGTEADLREIMLCIKHQTKFKKQKKVKKVRYCVQCTKPCKKTYVTNHAYSRVSSGSTFYTCSASCKNKLDSSLTTEDDDAKKWRFYDDNY